ncbi:MAG: hypothetical protein ACPG62_03005 [Cycloclasticus sp.]
MHILNMHWQDLAPLMQPHGVTSKNLFEDLAQVANIEGTATAGCICKKYGSEDIFPVEATVSAFKLDDDVFYQLSLTDLSQEKHWQNALHSKKTLLHFMRQPKKPVLLPHR